MRDASLIGNQGSHQGPEPEPDQADGLDPFEGPHEGERVRRPVQVPGYVHWLPPSFGVAVALNVESEDWKPGCRHGSGCEHFQAMEVDLLDAEGVTEDPPD